MIPRDRAMLQVRRGLGSAAFTLIEVAIVTGIISILASMAIPTTRQLLLQARAGAVENDLRVFSAAFQAYASEHGDWPPGDGSPGAFPEGMEGYLSQTNWQRRTPFGGNYAWDPNSLQRGLRYRAVIVLASSPNNPVTDDLAQLSQLDQKMDDGNLSTGSVFLGYRNYPVFVLEH